MRKPGKQEGEETAFQTMLRPKAKRELDLEKIITFDEEARKAGRGGDGLPNDAET
jgi:hypothetical protein